ncbi:MAG TPA: phosphotransferase enzyme family protein [Bacteroides sp.]|nr:phosphotransferase enzyme family protein [Bacteroides sp.]
MESLNRKNLQKLFLQTFGEKAGIPVKLPGAGSHREYYRMDFGGSRCIGVYSPDPLETRAFLEFTKHFSGLKLNVPRLLAEDADRGIYLLQDLGDITLKEEVDQSRKEGDYPGRIIPLYKKALKHLIRFQFEGHESLDYNVCVPRQEFDKQSILWDLNHFKYYFIKLLGIPFDEQALENDFQAFSERLSEAGTDHFLYRDFQSRNIMIFNDDLYFVDYQGGRRGALQYDVASLLFESRVNLSHELREELLEYYLELVQEETGMPGVEFKKHYYSFVLIRILQVLGAYGLRGIVENKALFLQSIPFAIRNIEWMRENSLIPEGLPELSACLERICRLDEWKFKEEPEELTVLISSFSYKKGLPRDLSGNGGGFVFDCRALPNPGREEKYRSLTGKDMKVIEFLEVKQEVKEFLEETFSLVEKSVAEYRSRGFNNLMVSYGCTGGQHRSVYSAERLEDYIKNELKVNTMLVHRELK